MKAVTNTMTGAELVAATNGLGPALEELQIVQAARRGVMAERAGVKAPEPPSFTPAEPVVDAGNQEFVVTFASDPNVRVIESLSFVLGLPRTQVQRFMIARDEKDIASRSILEEYYKAIVACIIYLAADDEPVVTQSTGWRGVMALYEGGGAEAGLLEYVIDLLVRYYQRRIAQKKLIVLGMGSTAASDTGATA